MRLSLFVLWGIAGLSIIGSDRWWERLLSRLRKPIPPPPDPPQDWPPHLPKGRPPRLNWLLPRITGVVGGIVGGWVFTQVFGPSPDPWLSAVPFPIPWMRVIYAASTTVGAFIGASLLTDLYGLVRGNRKVTRS